MRKFALILAMLFGMNMTSLAETLPKSENVIIQANGNREDFKNALRLATNMHEVLTEAKFEIMVFGNNVKLLTAFSDDLPAIQKVLDEGIKVIACGRSLKALDVNESDLAPGISTVPFGAVHIVNRQKQGWQYLKE